MAKKSVIALLSILIALPILGYARGYRSHSSIHSVRPYVNRHGSYHQWHLSANPRSGLRCRGNICGAKTW